MGNLNKPTYRRDYKGETLSYVRDGEMQSVFVTPRDLPYDLASSTAVVLGNGISRLDPTVKLILSQNNQRVAEGYKRTYACNAAYRDTPADYYVFKDGIFFAEIANDMHNKVFITNELWTSSYRDANLIPHVYHMDAGATAAYLAAFDGAKKIFLFGFDRTDGVTNENIYSDTLGYDGHEVIDDFRDFDTYLYNVIAAYSSVSFYRVRNHHSHNFDELFKTLPNYREVTIRDAVLLGDF